MEQISHHYFHQLYSNDKLTNMTFGWSASSLAKTLVWSPGCNILVIICHNSQEHYPNSLVCPQENYIVLLFAPIHQTNWPKVKVVKLNSFLNMSVSNIAQSNNTYFHEVLSDHINCPNSNKKLREMNSGQVGSRITWSNVKSGQVGVVLNSGKSHSSSLLNLIFCHYVSHITGKVDTA